MPQLLVDSYTEAVRNLVMEALSDEQLEILCFDHFRIVYDQFSESQSKKQKIQTLIEYCYRQDEFPKLLVQIKRLNPRRYQDFQLEQEEKASALRALVSVWPDERLDAICRANFYPVYEEFAAAPSRKEKIQILVEFCIQRDETTKLLSLFKEQNPSEYRAFLSRQAHNAVGLDEKQTLAKKMSFETIEQEYAQAPVTAESEQLDSINGFEDFTFRNRKKTAAKILQSEANHIELHGAIGVGKTYVVKHLAQAASNRKVQAVYIDLNTDSDIDQVLSETVRQLKGLPVSMKQATIGDLAASIHALHNVENGQGINHFLFLFDSASEENRQTIDWLISPEGLINNPQFTEMLELLGADAVKLQVVITARRPVVRITQYHRNLRFERMKLEPLRRTADPKEDPIQLMLREIASHSAFQMPQRLCQRISDEIYYLTGGHPKCAKLALFGVAERGFLLTREDWKYIFENYILPTIQREMLNSLPDDDLLPVLSRLSVFRRFDQRLLGALLERDILPVIVNGQNTSRQARRLRSRLIDTYLVREPDKVEAMYTLNFAVRRALSLNMQYHLPERYRAINSAAMEIFTNRLQGAQMPITRSVVSLLELVYHWLKGLEMDLEVEPEAICSRLQKALRRFLPTVLSAIDENERPIFLARFKAYWQADTDLQETAQRATEGSTCHDKLSRQINEFIQAYHKEYDTD